MIEFEELVNFGQGDVRVEAPRRRPGGSGQFVGVRGRAIGKIHAAAPRQRALHTEDGYRERRRDISKLDDDAPPCFAGAGLGDFQFSPLEH